MPLSGDELERRRRREKTKVVGHDDLIVALIRLADDLEDMETSSLSPRLENDQGIKMDETARLIWIEKAKRRLQNNDSLEDILADLRADGGSQIDTIIVLRGAVGMDLKQAKHTVHFSAAWADDKDRQERFWDQLGGVDNE